jgi:ADP-ribose pyrophosphatase YjhB (NUDIX family)
MEDGATIEEALRREKREELGVEIADVKPLFFTDDIRENLYPDGARRAVYMIHLLFAAPRTTRSCSTPSSPNRGGCPRSGSSATT